MEKTIWFERYHLPPAKRELSTIKENIHHITQLLEKRNSLLLRFADPPIENLATFTPSTYRERYQKFDKERDVSPWFNESSPITILNKKRKPILLMRDFPSFGAYLPILQKV